MGVMSYFKHGLLDGKTYIGSSITFADPLVTETLCDSTDFVWIDLEHSDMSAEIISGHLLAARSKKMPALVRIKGSSTPFIKPVLDAGAEGIVVPQIKSSVEVKNIIKDCLYSPRGERGYGPRISSNYGRRGGRQFADECNENIFIAVMIENRYALEDLEDILAVPGLDSIVIGPMDLSASLGVLGDIENPKVMSAIDMILEKAANAGMPVGIGLDANTASAVRFIKKGVQWIQFGCDFTYMIDFMEKAKMYIRSEEKHGG